MDLSRLLTDRHEICICLVRNEALKQFSKKFLPPIKKFGAGEHLKYSIALLNGMNFAQLQVPALLLI